MPLRVFRVSICQRKNSVKKNLNYLFCIVRGLGEKYAVRISFVKKISEFKKSFDVFTVLRKRKKKNLYFHNRVRKCFFSLSSECTKPTLAFTNIKYSENINYSSAPSKHISL